MIEQLPGLPDGVIGIEAVGRVESRDYTDVLDPVLEEVLQRREKVRLLYVLGERFEGFSAGAAWQDTRLGISHWGAWDRIAVVTDHAWIHDGVKALGWMLPGEVRAFHLDERDVATAWVAE